MLKTLSNSFFALILTAPRIFLLPTDMDDDCYPVITMTARQQHLQNRNTSNSVQSVCSTNDSSSISSSDIDVDDSNVKEEPLSPDSSSPPSPCAGYEINSNLANMAAYTNTDLVFEHKVSEDRDRTYWGSIAKFLFQNEVQRIVQKKNRQIQRREEKLNLPCHTICVAAQHSHCYRRNIFL